MDADRLRQDALLAIASAVRRPELSQPSSPPVGDVAFGSPARAISTAELHPEFEAQPAHAERMPSMLSVPAIPVAQDCQAQAVIDASESDVG
jgi:hypothetical protein